MANLDPNQADRPNRLPEPVRIGGSLSLVMPAHNEQENIGIVVQQALEVLPRFADKFEIIIVNDGSRDGTARIVDELAAAHPQVRPVHHKVNRGYGGALVSGFGATTGDYVMFMDSDRQFDLNDLALLSPFVGHFDIVAGFRRERNDPLHRRVNAEVFNTVVRALYGVHMRDIDCAFKIFRGDLLRSITLTSSGALINTEMQARLRRKGRDAATGRGPPLPACRRRGHRGPICASLPGPCARR